ncbi:MAG TPA: M48 family metalloprotease [Candidatus Paceibacterota bacterium]
MATLYTHQSKNVTKTWLLMGVFLALIAAVGYFGSYYYGNPGIFYIAIFISVAMNITGYWFSDKIALSMSGAKPVDPEKSSDPARDRELVRMVENLSITAGLPVPAIYIIEDPAPNAFATGRNKEHAAVAVTTGLLALLDKSELEGVIAHELAHIGNRDTLIATVVVILVGIVSILSDIMLRSTIYGNRSDDNKAGGVLAIIGIVLLILSPLFATMLQLAISRRREYVADATGALLTRYPEGLASALQKITGYAERGGQPLARASDATAHLFISNPFGAKALNGLHKLFMTHPPAEKRIAALRGMDIK